MRSFPIVLSILLFFSIAPIASGAQQIRVPITTGGNIRYSSGAHKLFSTSFDDVTVIGTHSLSIPISHYFWYGPPDSPFWIDAGGESHGGYTSPIPHSGSHMLGMSRVSTDRAEFLIQGEYPWDPEATNGHRTFYVSVWYYFPVGWTISKTASDKYENMMTYDDSIEGDYPDLAVMISGGTNHPDGPYCVMLNSRDANGQWTYVPDYSSPEWVRDFQPVRGGWSHWELYVDRGTPDNHDGSAKLWIDGVLKREATGLLLTSEKNRQYGDMILDPFDQYTGMNDGPGSETRWIDDLEIWDGIPSYDL